MWELLSGFCQGFELALTGTFLMVVALGVVYCFFKCLGWVCDGIREWALHWWAVGTLAFLPQDSKLAREIRCKHDLHDYCDGSPYEPCHFYTYHCDRCGKCFVI